VTRPAPQRRADRRRSTAFVRAGQEKTRRRDTRCEIGRAHEGLTGAEVLLTRRARDHVAAWGWSARLAVLAAAREQGGPSAETALAIALERVNGRGHDALRLRSLLPPDINGRETWTTLYAVLTAYWAHRDQLWTGERHLDAFHTPEGLAITRRDARDAPLVVVGQTATTGEVWVPEALLPTPRPYLLPGRDALGHHRPSPGVLGFERLEVASLLEAVAGAARLVVRTDCPVVAAAARLLGHEVVDR